MVKNPATVKAWRAQIGDTFLDNRFFNAPPSSHTSWKPLIQALMASDKERLVELTGQSFSTCEKRLELISIFLDS